VKGIRKGGFRRLAVVVAVAAAGILVVGAHGALAQGGFVQICKSGANGMTGRSFQYTISGMAGQFSAIGGRCTGAIDTGQAQVTITELQSSPATDVSAIVVRPSSYLVGAVDLANRRITVRTQTPTCNSVSCEALVTFTNEPAGGTSGTVKICKLTQTPAFLGLSYTFTVSGVPGTVSATANDANSLPATWSCTIAGTFQVGSRVTVDEQVPAGQVVQFIDTDPPSALFDFNLDTGTAIVDVGAGTTIVLFDDEPIPPTQTGFIEVCKNPFPFQDPAVTGVWTFTITDAANFVQVVPVITNQCSGPIPVAAGIATVRETPRVGFEMTGVFTIPAGALLGSNNINGTATVDVPVSATTNGEVQVNFINEAVRNQLKVCKALGPSSGDLIGQTFYFRVTDITDPLNPVVLTPNPLSIQAAATTQCRPFGDLPVGTTVQVEEVFFGPDNPNTPGDESGTFIDQTGPVTATIGSGVTIVTITDTARGLLEVCKAPVSGLTLAAQPTFRFQIDGGAIFSVTAGTCRPSQRVSVGDHTVTEIADQNFDVLAILVSPPDRAKNISTANRTATVSVPFGPNGETAVTFVNAIKAGFVKVCKDVPLTSQNSLGNDDWNFTVFVQNGPTGPGSFTAIPVGPIKAGQCTFPVGPFPILNADGSKRAIGVHEGPDPAGEIRNVTYRTTSITVGGSRGLCFVTDPGVNQTVCPYTAANNPNLTLGDIDFYLGPNINEVRYTNQSI
jgi:hypothetical protein